MLGRPDAPIGSDMMRYDIRALRKEVVHMRSTNADAMDTTDITEETLDTDRPDILEQVRAKAREIGRMPDMGADGDATAEQKGLHIIRVKADTIPKKLAYHITNVLKDPRNGGIAICQSIGPAANQKADLAVVEAQAIIVKYMPTSTLVVLPCIRKPTMDNDEERTAIRKLIFAINHKLVP
jgi:stage V sporulation protein SpoVS